MQLSAAPPGAVQELREAIATFAAVKPSLAWSETYPGTLSYYLASAFGEVWMQPSGTVGLIGFATNALFLRDALDKAGIEAQFVARGEYKSAANLFTQDRYTEAHREADSRMIESLHGQVWTAIAESRGVDVGTLDELANRAPLLREDALTARLVDRIGFRDEAYARIIELIAAPDRDVTGDVTGGVTGDVTDRDVTDRGVTERDVIGGDVTGGADPDGEDAPPRLFLSNYAATRERLPSIPGGKPKPAIAVVTVAGPIVSGRGGPQVLPMSRSSAGGDTIAAALREAASKDDVTAVVLRVDSPGGSVTGSETIWREICRLREKGKPVVASMGSVAASGGYYIAMAADTIVANPGTITGSIGVVTGKLVARDLKERLGVGSDVVRTNTNADAWSINAPFTAEQHDMVEAEADLFYDDFVRRVAESRSMTVEEVDGIARGRIWTGADAHERGLVDELGGFRVAVRRAKVLAGLDVDAEVRLAAYPGSSVRDMLRHESSSRPAALVDAIAVLLGGRTTALWVGEWRF